MVALKATGVGVHRWSARQGTETVLLDNVDWTVESGQHWVLMGPNGAGKTTLLRIIGAESHPTSGEVEILGRQLGRYDVRVLRERIGFVDERLDRSLRGRGRMSAREIVLTGAYGAVVLREDRLTAADHAHAAELLELVGLSYLAERRFAECSQGERGRLLLARALMSHPELLLLDEPAAGLDMPSRERFIETMVRTAAICRPALNWSKRSSTRPSRTSKPPPTWCSSCSPEQRSAQPAAPQQPAILSSRHIRRPIFRPLRPSPQPDPLRNLGHERNAEPL